MPDRPAPRAVELAWDVVPSPLGPLSLVTRRRVLCLLEFGRAPRGLRARLRRRFGPLALRRGPAPAAVRQRLGAYWRGDLRALDGIAVDPGGSPWERRVWRALRRIPPGQTRSYGALARRLGRPGAARAVGSANARNPVAIVIPCHRLVGADAALTGYGGGLARKRALLVHEGGTMRPPDTTGRPA